MECPITSPGTKTSIPASITISSITGNKPIASLPSTSIASVGAEIFSDDEIRSPQELAIGVPADNLTVLGLARKLAAKIGPEPIPSAGTGRDAWTQSKRVQLKSVVRYKAVSVTRALRMANSKGMGFQSLSYRFDLSNG